MHCIQESCGLLKSVVFKSVKVRRGKGKRYAKQKISNRLRFIFFFVCFYLLFLTPLPRRGCSSHGRAVDSHGRRKIRQVRRSILRTSTFFLRGACALQARGDLRRLERFWSAIHDSEIEITFEKKCASQRPKTAFFLL